jgi:hypothetical protein
MASSERSITVRFTDDIDPTSYAAIANSVWWLLTVTDRRFTVEVDEHADAASLEAVYHDVPVWGRTKT